MKHHSARCMLYMLPVERLSHRHQLVPPRCGTAGELLPLHVPRSCTEPLGGGEDLALAVAGVEGVHGGVQARLLGWRRSVEEVGLVRRAGLFEAEEHDARLAVARPSDVERFHFLADGAEHLVRSVRGRGEHDRAAKKVSAAARSEDLRVDIAPCCEKPVSAQFGGCLRCVGGK